MSEKQDSNSKIHVNLHQGILDVEGEQSFVREIYDDFKNSQLEISDSPSTKTSAAKSRAHKVGGNKKSTKKIKPKNTKKNQVYEMQNINLGKSGDSNSIFDYVKIYQPQTDAQRNVVFVHYLKEQHSSVKVNLNYIYTCYAKMDLKFPVNLYESVANIGKPSVSQRHYLNLSDRSDITLTLKGKNFIRELKSNAESKNVAN